MNELFTGISGEVGLFVAASFVVSGILGALVGYLTTKEKR